MDVEGAAKCAHCGTMVRAARLESHILNRCRDAPKDIRRARAERIAEEAREKEWQRVSRFAKPDYCVASYWPCFWQGGSPGLGKRH